MVTERFLLSAVLLLSSASTAAPGQSASSVPRSRCDSPDYRSFDFWIGDWNVSKGDEHAGTNSITLEEDGCLIHEHWKGVEGGSGQSFNYFDWSDGKWHQVWIAANGTVLVLAGEYRESRMTLSGERPDRQDGSITVKHKVTFAHNPDGTVRQEWEVSRDGGATWKTIFDGLYRRRQKG